jgi:hypothetical protein
MDFFTIIRKMNLKEESDNCKIGYLADKLSQALTLLAETDPVSAQEILDSISADKLILSNQ